LLNGFRAKRASCWGGPIGATGAVLTTKPIHSMRRDDLTRGPVTLYVGGGQGIALAIEALH
jgi:acetyl-CoA C-acetyltransferase